MFPSKSLKKFALYVSTAFFIALSISFFYAYSLTVVESLNGTLRDYMFNFRGEIKQHDNVVIIDIDEKSLDKIGQWPWGRDKVGELLNALTDANVAAIGMDIVFAENDSTSPHKILGDFNISIKGIKNNDEIFAKVVASTPTILAYQFQIDGETYLKQGNINIPAIIIEKNKQSSDDYVLKAKGVILNIPSLQNNSYSSGFFNNIPDESGMIRSVPLIINYDDQMYPSLDLELIRASLGIKKIVINYKEKGIESLSIGDLFIPTDRHGRLLINFRGGANTFKYISVSDVLEHKFKLEDLENKIVIVGTSAAGLKDLRSMPFDKVYPGVEIHANVIDNILEQDFLSIPIIADDINILIIFIISILTVLLVTYSPLWANPFIMIILSSIMTYIVYNALFGYQIVLDLFLPLFAIFISTIIATFMDYMFEMRQEQKIKNKFARKVSEDVMKSLLKDIDNNEFQAIEREVTIFFSDVRNFTNISEAAIDAKNLIEFLNMYMNPMTDIIVNHKGTIDKYIGDAIMAYWNAPSLIKNHAKEAVLSALEQLHEIRKLNIKIKNDDRFKSIVHMAKINSIEPIDIGIGINTGIAVVGEMGSSKRSDYTVIGDSINLGARLESLCKFYDSKLNISSFTKSHLDDNYIFRYLDLVRVKGKKEPVEIWQIHDIDYSENKNTLYNITKDEILNELSLYHKAIDLYKNAEFKKAFDKLTQLNKLPNKTNKNIYNIYIQRCSDYLIKPPTNFDGIYDHKTKG
jgi:adenylate cyclase